MQVQVRGGRAQFGGALDSEDAGVRRGGIVFRFGPEVVP